MYTIHVVGASHGRRIGDALKKQKGYGTRGKKICF